MASGVSSGTWGYSPLQVAGMNEVAEYKNTPLTYNLGLTSVTPSFEGDNFISPLTTANKGFYTVSRFGKKPKRTLKSILRDIRFLKK
jgi:hypothetical protein